MRRNHKTRVSTALFVALLLAGHPARALPPEGEVPPGGDSTARPAPARPSDTERPAATAPPSGTQTRDSEMPGRTVKRSGNVGSNGNGNGSNKNSPVVTAKAGNWGMFFRFGGLADLDHGNNSRVVNGVLLTQVGMRYVFSPHWIMPIYFGTGVRLIQPADDTQNDQGDWGMEVGVGIEYHFRIWRRISPFVGFSLGMGVVDPTGSDNLTFGLGFGPSLGVEYFVADRVSITVAYLMVFQFEFMQLGEDPLNPGETLTQKAIQFNTIAGGAVNLTYYF